jgi:transposase
MDAQAAGAQPPFRDLILRQSAIPGVSFPSATAILTEIGRDMSRFPTAGYLVAWAGLCPGQNESAGKRTSARLRRGAPRLKTYHMLKSGLPHRDLGADYFDRRSPEAKAKRLVGQFAKLGFAAQLQPLAA